MQDLKCIVTGKSGAEYHHLYTRKAAPELEHEPYNKIPLSRFHHIECHAIGLKSFANKYGKVRKWLQINEWTLCPIKMTWENYELREKQIQFYHNKL